MTVFVRFISLRRLSSTNRRCRPASAQQFLTNNAATAPAAGLGVGQHKVEIGCDRRRSRWRYNYQKIRAISFEIAQMKKMRVSSIRSGQFQATGAKTDTNLIQSIGDAATTGRMSTDL